MPKPNRKGNRLSEYDYSSAGYYFVTMCTYGMQCWFGEVMNGGMVLNKFGEIAKQCWLNLPNHYPNCQLDDWVIMPNHVHGIVIIDEVTIVPVGTGFKPVPTNTGNRNHSLSEIIRGFKTFSSRRINENKVITQSRFHWQRSFYDHIIRNEKSYEKIKRYLYDNPLRWECDKNGEDELEF